MRLVVATAAVALGLALVIALVVPRLGQAQPGYLRPLVVDVPTRPGIAWSAESGQTCPNPFPGDRAILSVDNRVWSLDLTTGEQQWSTAFDGLGLVSCLPGANLVAITTIDPHNDAILGTTFLNAASGAEVARLNDGTTAQVIPLGSRIGLVDGTLKLTAVDPKALDAPLWSRQLPGSPGVPSAMLVTNVADDVVQLDYDTGDTADGADGYYTLILAAADGTSPPWTRDSADGGSSQGRSSYHRLGDVIVHQGYDGFDVVDLQGTPLWDPGEDQLGVAGSRLFVAWPSSSDPDTGFTNLHQVDPRTGARLGADSFQGWFDHSLGVGDRIAVVRGGSLLILDEHLQEQPGIALPDLRSLFVGDDWVYTDSAPGRTDGAGALLSAIDPDGARILWTFDLAPAQYMEQMGRHMVVVDFDKGTFHGLRSQR